MEDLLNFRKNTIALLLAIIMFCFYILSKYNYDASCFILMFAVGALCKKARNILHVKIKYIEIFSILSFLLCFYFGFNSNPLTLSMTLIYGAFFLSICMKASWFGLLKLRGFVRLGDASFSIYLLHAVFWFLMNKVCFHFHMENNIKIYYLISTFVWFLICFSSMITFNFIERKSILIGKIISCKFNTKV
jgi:peptidoglycan/LPS O-acetylase OafA/YrhL